MNAFSLLPHYYLFLNYPFVLTAALPSEPIPDRSSASKQGKPDCRLGNSLAASPAFSEADLKP